MRFYCLALLGAFASVPAAAAPGAPVAVSVSGIPAGKGRVHVDICTEKTFTKENCPWSAEAPARAGTTVVRVPGVPPGRYAAQAYWDANDNGKADRNFVGMPMELVGFSRDVRVKLSRPKFVDAAFAHGDEPSSIALTVRKVP